MTGSYHKPFRAKTSALSIGRANGRGNLGNNRLPGWSGGKAQSVDGRPARHCQVQGCSKPARAFVVRGEVFVGPPQESFQAGVCASHMAEVLDISQRNKVLAGLVSAYPSVR